MTPEILAPAIDRASSYLPDAGPGSVTKPVIPW